MTVFIWTQVCVETWRPTEQSIPPQDLYWLHGLETWFHQSFLQVNTFRTLHNICLGCLRPFLHSSTCNYYTWSTRTPFSAFLSGSCCYKDLIGFLIHNSGMKLWVVSRSGFHFLIVTDCFGHNLDAFSDLNHLELSNGSNFLPNSLSGWRIMNLAWLSIISWLFTELLDESSLCFG